MEVMSFLKAVPAVIGIAGLLTYFVRARKPESDLELANIVQRVRNTFLLLGCEPRCWVEGGHSLKPPK
jgi:hypothetical protein